MSAIPISNQLPSAAQTTSSSSNLKLSPSDFINLMVTELQHQDPMQPTSNDQLLSEMSEIGQLQSSDQLQTSLSSMVLQTQISSAGALIGKAVKGLDDNNNAVAGTVNSINVQSGQVYLQLDSGASLSLGRVTSVAPVAPAAQTMTAATTTPTTAN